MRAVRGKGRIVALAGSVLVLACSHGSSPRAEATRSSDAADGAPEGGAPEPPASALRSFARAALAGAIALDARGDDRAAYLALRRGLLASMEAWRRAISPAAELALGPEIAFDEAGGALGALDRAMDRGDVAAVKRQTHLLDRALRLADMELGRRGIPARLFASALSDSAYDLGQAIAESTVYVPEGDDAALADVTGLLDAIDAGAKALDLDLGETLAPFASVRAASTLADVSNRAALVRATGVLGSRIRLRARERGLKVYPRFPTHTPTDEVSALTLPRPAAPADPARAQLGERIFFDERLSRGGARSCATCHVPARAFADGLVVPVSLDPHTLLARNTPGLLYAPLAARLTWDGRVRTADLQALDVLHTRAEMGLGDEGLLRAVESAYGEGFRAAFAESPTTGDVGLALSAFEASALVLDRSPLDRFGRGGATLSDDARAGFDVFAGKGRCARCHVPPVFGGSRPPDFTVPVYSVIGAPSSLAGHVLDADVGRAAITHDARDSGAFKVPTVRDVGRTAPYFHNGRYPTLEDVVDFYDKGGGRGLGIALPAQDPDVRPLHLTAEDKRVLLVFLREGLDDGP